MTVTAEDRVKVVFELFDVDHSGFLEGSDFTAMSDRVEQVADGSGPEAKAALRASFAKWWTTVERELDANRDGKVSYDEFTACVLSPEKFDDTVTDFAHALSALGDPDGDGLIERPLFTALMLAIGFSPANIDALFDVFGPDAEDRIAVSVWSDGIVDYYHPTKPDVAGNYLVS
ncbi:MULTISPECIES: EF-hand domain-containing protein [unclassified Amycolatopsis]|uniref:EF-hand domain-containing protein n=1 Tax=unclassified Amycolatopsis TaxID=2618356 RepID=UPI001C6A287D|nr:EF-hand domain-containing protein [Amycolatopsis sp. DSM 110486]QYN22729.1 EF-hand domain-containing protein [Amycolatopsis sp. DSM 110486]